MSVVAYEIEQRPKHTPRFTADQTDWAAPDEISSSTADIFRDIHFGDLRSIRRFSQGWDTYAAPAPNDIAVENAARILRFLDAEVLIRARVLPSAEGGVGIAFVNQDRYADLECSNDGDILGVRYTGHQAPTLIQPNGSDISILAALREIKAHIFG